ncbi:MAG: hypothetical protein IKL88_07445, partial [Erysipelotrichales bacterium]|nr:hypothetical protein [Erysipelotrichales bacterium]
KALEYTAELFDSSQANFIKKEDGVYMGINAQPVGLGGDWPTMGSTIYTYDTEDATYAYIPNWSRREEDLYYYYYSFKFTKTPEGLRY